MDRVPTVGVRVLGATELAFGDDVIAVPSRRQRTILAVLAAAAGEPVSADALIDAVWGEDPPNTPSRALQTQLSRVRNLLGAAATSLVTTPGGYVLDVDRSRVDAWAFESRVRDAVDQPPARRAEILASALSLWRGRAFAEVADRAAVQPVAARLDELHTSAREDHAEALLEAGSVGEALASIEALAADDALRERTQALLMRALYAAGRPREAIDRFQEFRRLLANELGLTPSPALVDLERAILTHQLPTPHRGGPPWRRSALPTLPVSELIGRRGELVDVADLLAAARIVTVAGPGGVGKTRLALHTAHDVADRYPDGVWWCDLTSATGADVAVTVAAAMGVEERAGDTIVERLVAVLRTRRALLVLDNCEHVLDATAELVDHVVRSAGEVDVLATSREPLAVDGEHRFRLEPLAVPTGGEVTDAVLMFLQRARAVNPNANTDGTAWDATLDICRTLDGLPLALEFAAARVAHMTVADVARQLDHRFELLAAHPGRSEPRHASLAAALEWSHQLLVPDEQRLLDALALFVGRFTLDDARQLCAEVTTGDLRSVPDGVASLVDKSLVELSAARSSTTYSLLESVRAYSLERLTSAGDLGAWQQRHAEFTVEFAARADAAIRGPEEPEWRRRIDDHLGDLRAARAWLLAHGDIDGLLRLCAGLDSYAEFRTRSEPHRWAEDAVGRATTGRPHHRDLAKVCALAASGASKRGELDVAERWARRADVVSGARSGYGVEVLSRLALFRGDLEYAIAYSREAVARHRANGDSLRTVLAGTVEVLGLQYLGHDDDAQHAAAGLLGAAHQVGAPSTIAMCEYCTAEVVIAHPDRAREHLWRSLELARSVGADFVYGLAITTLAGLDARGDHPADAFGRLHDAIEHWERSGLGKQQWWLTLRMLIEALGATGEHSYEAALLASAFRTSDTTAPVYGTDAARLDAAVDAARSRLAADEFAAATARGATFGDDDALSCGREVLTEILG